MQHQFHHTVRDAFSKRGFSYVGTPPQLQATRQRNLLHPLLSRSYQGCRFKTAYERSPKYARAEDEILDDAAIIALGEAAQLAAIDKDWAPHLAVKDVYYGLAHHELSRSYDKKAVQRAIEAHDFEDRYYAALHRRQEAVKQEEQQQHALPTVATITQQQLQQQTKVQQ